MVYLFVFFLSILILFVEENCNFRKGTKYLLTVLALAPPLLLAMFRADSVGIDVKVYVIHDFKLALHFQNFYMYNKAVKMEIGYAFLNYLLSRVTDTIIWMHFFNELLGLLPLLIIGKISEPKLQKWQVMGAFYFMFYNVSLNAVRQSIACSWCMLGFVFLIKRNYVKALIGLAIAISFHLSTVFILVLIPFVVALERRTIKREALVIMIISVGGIFMSAKLWLRPLLEAMPILVRTKYLNYLSGSEIVSGIGTFHVLFKIICLIISIMLFINNRDNQINEFIIIVEVISIMLIPLATSINFGYRIVRFFDYFSILLIPQIPSLFKRDKTNQIAAFSLATALLLVYWWFNYCRINNGLTLPYVFSEQILV